MARRTIAEVLEGIKEAKSEATVRDELKSCLKREIVAVVREFYGEAISCMKEEDKKDELLDKGVRLVMFKKKEEKYLEQPLEGKAEMLLEVNTREMQVLVETETSMYDLIRLYVEYEIPYEKFEKEHRAMYSNGENVRNMLRYVLMVEIYKNVAELKRRLETESKCSWSNRRPKE